MPLNGVLALEHEPLVSEDVQVSRRRALEGDKWSERWDRDAGGEWQRKNRGEINKRDRGLAALERVGALPNRNRRHRRSRQDRRQVEGGGRSDDWARPHHGQEGGRDRDGECSVCKHAGAGCSSRLETSSLQLRRASIRLICRRQNTVGSTTRDTSSSLRLLHEPAVCSARRARQQLDFAGDAFDR